MEKNKKVQPFTNFMKIVHNLYENIHRYWKRHMKSSKPKKVFVNVLYRYIKYVLNPLHNRLLFLVYHSFVRVNMV